MIQADELPLILAGPLVRRVTSEVFTLWLVGSGALRLKLRLIQAGELLYEQELAEPELRVLPVGERAFVHCIQVSSLQKPFKGYLNYELSCLVGAEWLKLSDLLPDLGYQGALPRIPVAGTLREILHGSCRKPHHPSPDALVAADQLLAERYRLGQDPPDLLMMTGDQVYVDDLCGPLLLAVQQVIRLLGLPNERFSGTALADAEALYVSADNLYGRRRFLPLLLAENRYSRLFNNGARPVFTSSYCDNHLISFAEVFALYLLCWSPALWPLIRLPQAQDLALDQTKQKLYHKESLLLERFVAGLPQVRRLLAHLPSYMIFDDHDVTDDWNLTEAWENAAYQHAFSRRIIGNALMAYWLCQGWGNQPEAFAQDFWQQALAYCKQPSSQTQDAWIDGLLAFEGWQYSLPTQPKLVVLDTRTRRWHSESSPYKPSGLMNWEALSELQLALMDQPAVVLVSAAPMFGVKFVEVLQALLTLLGKALAVDAENWMAHPEAAYTLLNIFKHQRTPRSFVILSGDVHYSFVYDIVLRFRRNSPQIWQITASGLKNEFPHKILRRLAQFNRVLFHRASPLNWLTRRKGMLIESRLVNGVNGQELYNHSAIGLVRFNQVGAPVQIGLLTGTQQKIFFEPDPDSPIGPVPAEHSKSESASATIF